MIAGITHATGGEDIRSHLHLDGFTAHSKQDIANRVNSALLEPMPDNIPLEVCNALLELNPRKASEPDGIKLWLRQDYADFLTSPVCGILNPGLRHSECIILRAQTLKVLEGCRCHT